LYRPGHCRIRVRRCLQRDTATGERGCTIESQTGPASCSSVFKAATIYSIIETAKLNGLDPEAYLRTLITRIAAHPAKRIDELLPWNIKL
jgi:hypothetical protein